MSLCHLDSYVWVVCLWKSFSKMCIFSACGWWAPTNFWAFGSLESSEKSRISWGSTNFLEAWNVRAQKTFEQQFCFTWEVFCPIGSDMFCTLCDSLGRSLVFACCNNSCAISVKSRSTLSQLLAEVCRKYIPCLLANSSPTSRGISWSSRSILFPTNTRNTLGDAYSSISLNQSGQQSKVGWLETS